MTHLDHHSNQKFPILKGPHEILEVLKGQSQLVFDIPPEQGYLQTDPPGEKVSGFWLKVAGWGFLVVAPKNQQQAFNVTSMEVDFHVISRHFTAFTSRFNQRDVKGRAVVQRMLFLPTPSVQGQASNEVLSGPCPLGIVFPILQLIDGSFTNSKKKWCVPALQPTQFGEKYSGGIWWWICPLDYLMIIW